MLKNRLLAVVLAGLIFLAPGLGSAEEAFVIQPVGDSSEIRAFSSQGWLTMGSLPPREHELMKLSYLRGFLDAVQFAEVAPGQTTQVLEDLKGTNLKQVTDQIDKFYQTYPQYQSYSPAVVMLVILPRLKSGKSPIPEPGEAPAPPNPAQKQK